MATHCGIKMSRMAAMGVWAIVSTGVAVAGPIPVTYQGQLKLDGLPVDATLAMRFSLFRELADPEPIDVQSIEMVAVTGGLFTVELLFSEDLFNGDPRYLEIAVAGGEPGAFSPLTPRQPMNPVPYAVRAFNVPGGGGSVWQQVGLDISYTAGHVGVGLVGPSYPLHVEASAAHAIHGVNQSTTNFTAGIYGESTGSNGYGIHGNAPAGSCNATGVFGEAVSAGGRGVHGKVSHADGRWSYGVYGEAAGTRARGVFGRATSPSGANYGVYGQATSADGVGVYGYNDAAIGLAVGVHGSCTSVAGSGVFGEATSTTGTTYGVRGESASHIGSGVYGKATSDTGSAVGVKGDSAAPVGSGVEGWNSGGGIGVYGRVTNGGWAGYFQGNTHVSGNLGVGTTLPDARLHVSGTVKADSPGTAVEANGGTYGVHGTGTTYGIYGDAATGYGVYGYSGGYSPDGNGGVYGEGYISPGVKARGGGVGTTNPALHVENVNASGIGIFSTTTSTDPNAVFVNEGEGDLIKGFSGPGGGDLVFRVTGTGRAVVNVLQINGGADLSEQFDVKATAGEVRPGMVVCIDPTDAGKLVVASSAHDRTVAGIISGAGGINPGMLMGQRGSEAHGAHPVALTGRVYAWADAAGGSIEPGDLLTTSDTPGHAMRVSDYDKARGAILGKAMTKLEGGRGLVLVLVSLQ